MIKRLVVVVIMGAMVIMGVFGCGAAKYRLEFDGYGLQSKKTTYAEGETVTVTYDMIATDTDYSFYTDSDDVKLNREYDGNRGYVFTFTMPSHDVKISVKSRDSMEMDPDANRPEEYTPQSPEGYITNENLLFDYYEATVATVGGDGHDEFCLYKYTDDQLILARYRKMEGEDETMDYCIVPEVVLDDCNNLVKKYKMQKWEDGTGLNGKVYVVKFMDGGQLKRVSSDDMPQDGQKAFTEISSSIGTAWGEYYSVNDTGTWFCPECGTKNNGKYCMECGFEHSSDDD